MVLKTVSVLVSGFSLRSIRGKKKTFLDTVNLPWFRFLLYGEMICTLEDLFISMTIQKIYTFISDAKMLWSTYTGCYIFFR